MRLVGPGRRMHLKFTDWSEGNNNVVWLLLTWKYYVSSVMFRLQDVVTISNPISHSWSLDLYFNPPDLTSRHELLKKNLDHRTSFKTDEKLEDRKLWNECTSSWVGCYLVSLLPQVLTIPALTISLWAAAARYLTSLQGGIWTHDYPYL